MLSPWKRKQESTKGGTDKTIFAKVFGQIFDSSIAEDYNCRRMFMDLLVLADSTGAVDMTVEAISRRTNVPVEEVVKYVKELCQPDTKSRSKLEEGKRLIPLDSRRDWGWQIVNYKHYRKIRDEAARREYFRDKQREHRKKKKKAVKDIVLTDSNKVGQVLTSPSSSSSTSYLEDLKKNPIHALIDIDRELEKASQWCKKKNRKLTQRFFNNWLKNADRSIPTPSKPKHLPSLNDTPQEEREKILAAGRAAVGKLSQQFKMPK